MVPVESVCGLGEVVTHLLDKHVKVLGDLRGEAYLQISPSVKGPSRGLVVESGLCRACSSIDLSNGLHRTVGLQDTEDLVTCIDC